MYFCENIITLVVVPYNYHIVPTYLILNANGIDKLIQIKLEPLPVFPSWPSALRS